MSEFRSRLIDGEAERLLFDLMLERFRKLGLLKAHGRQRTDASHVLAAVARHPGRSVVPGALQYTRRILQRLVVRVTISAHGAQRSSRG